MSLPLTESQIAGGDVQDMRQDLAQVYSLARRNDGSYRLNDVPLVVITKSPTGSAGPLGPEKRKFNDQLSDELARASRFGKHLIATKNDHHIQLTEPDLITNAIRDTVSLAVKLRSMPR